MIEGKSGSLDSGLYDGYECKDDVQTCKSTDSKDSGVTTGSGGSDNSEKPLLATVCDKDTFVTVCGQNTVICHMLQKEPLTDFHDDVPDERHVDRPDCYGDKRFWIKVNVIFIVLNVLLLVTIFVVCFGLPGKGSPQAALQHCLSCSDVYLSEDDIRDNIYNFNITDALCCSHNRTYIAQKYVLKRYKSDSARDSSHSTYPRRAAVHLKLDLTGNYSRAVCINHTLKWSQTDGLTSGNLTLSRDGTQIEVNRSGLYFLSPKVTFADNETDVGGTLKPMLVQVYKQTGSEHTLLLERKDTHCANTKSTCNIHSSTQGMFRFESGDRVYVHVRMPCGLVMKPHMNQFDMYLI